MKKQTPGGVSQEDALLIARVEEAVRSAEFRCVPAFVGFLDERQARLAAAVIGRNRAVTPVFDGGYDDAERKMLGVFPDFAEADREQFPFGAVTVRFRPGAGITHRDLLGSLMSLGVRRDVLGDLLTEDGRAVFFAREEMIPFFLSELTKVGGEGVKTQQGAELPLPAGAEFSPVSGVIASPRLDCVVAALCGCSREKAAEQIRRGIVTLNFAECTEVSKQVAEGQKISVRGKGKFAVDRIGPETKKGRLGFRARKYI